MILSDFSILEEIQKTNLVIDPFQKKFLQPSSYDVALDSSFRIFQNHKISYVDVKKKEKITEIVKIRKRGSFIIHPGEFVLGNTIERFKIPAYLAAKLEGRSSLGRLGLIIHATSGYVDPGFWGQLTFEISNISSLPIKLYAGMRIAQICFFRMTTSVKRPYGQAGNKYQGQLGPTESKIFEEFKSHQTE